MITINPYDAFTKEDLPEDFTECCYHSGKCDEGVNEFSKGFEVPDKEYLKNFLNGYGAWNDEELKDHEQNVKRLIWLIAGDLTDQNMFYYGM